MNTYAWIGFVAVLWCVVGSPAALALGFLIALGTEPVRVVTTGGRR